MISRARSTHARPHGVARCLPSTKKWLGARRALITQSEDFDAELEASKLPFVTIHGADSVILPAMSAHIASVHPGTRTTVIPGAGHVVPEEARAAFEAAVRASL